MKISVITISYNAVTCIEPTIMSVINQKYNSFEYIIVDGASNDGTLDVLKKYDQYITRWISEPDSGIYNAMNKAVKMAKGEYCIFMNAGDRFANPLVLKQVSLFLNDGFDYLCGNEISLKSGKVIDYVYAPTCITKDLFVNRSLSHQASFIKRELLLSNPYDEKLKLVSDWKFCIEILLLQHKKYRSIDVDVCKFNHDGATFTQKELGKKERMKVLQELLPNEYNQIKKHKQSYIDIIAEHCMESFEWANIYNVAAKKFTTMFTYIQVMGFLGLLAVLGKMIPGVLGLKIKHKAILSYLKKKYGYVVNNNANIVDKQVSIGDKFPIWVCWWQGENMMPLVPKICLASLRKNLLPDQKLYIISSDNYKDFVEIPIYIISMLKEGRISITNFSDILRFSLLAKYGGLWIDSTCLASQKMNDLSHMPFITSKQKTSNVAQYVSAYRWASYLIGGNSLCIFQNMRDLFFAYCKNEKKILDYLLLDYLLVVIYELCPEAKSIIDEFPYDKGNMLKLAGCLNENLKDKDFSSMLENVPIHKLSWKIKYFPYDKEGHLTIFGKLLEIIQ